MRLRSERRRAPLPAAAALAAASLALLAPCGAAAQAPPPVVEVTFHVDPGSQLAHPDWLDGREIRAAQDRLSKLLAGLCQSHFGFIRWSPVLPSRPVSPAVRRLTLRLRDVQRPGGVETKLAFTRTVAGREEPIPTLAAFTLIDWWQPDRPTTADQLYDLVAAKLDANEMFAGESFRGALHDRFLKGIPLASRVIALQQDKRVIVPLRWDDIRADGDTVLLVKFVTLCSPAQPTEATMRLSLVARRAGQPHLGALQSAITLFDCAPLVLDAWSDDIPDLLSPNAVRNLAVFMDRYVQAPLDSASVDGLVTDPH